MLFLDLDGFEQVNRVHGHDVGDAVLMAVAQRLREFCETHPGEAARLGGDEFGLFLRDVESPMDAARELFAALAQPITVMGVELMIRASAGLAGLNSATDSALEWVRRAERAMYLAKSRGGNQICECSNTAANP